MSAENDLLWTPPPCMHLSTVILTSPYRHPHAKMLELIMTCHHGMVRYADFQVRFQVQPLN